jgi:hypothetical protein
MCNVHACDSACSKVKWCCYITVDSAMAASQNGFCSYRLSIHKKTNIMQIMTKNITFFINLIFYHKEIVKLQTTNYKIHRFEAATGKIMGIVTLKLISHNLPF